jgi:hypothetical protein
MAMEGHTVLMLHEQLARLAEEAHLPVNLKVEVLHLRSLRAAKLFSPILFRSPFSGAVMRSMD